MDFNRAGEKKFLFFWLRILIVLILITYQVVTIICHDFVVLKFSRDIILLGLGFIVYSKRKNRIEAYDVFCVLFCFMCLWGLYKSDDLSLGITALRKYLFPLILFCVIIKLNFQEIEVEKLLIFMMVFVGFLSMWGVFQAMILKDQFLIELGYPTSYLYAYKKYMLGYSYYFGGFGIQRVVATMANSNECGLVFGATLIIISAIYPSIRFKFKSIFLAFIIVGYVLTFSRSNFLALFVVLALLLWKYIPHKKKIIISFCIVFLFFVLVSIFMGKNGIGYKIWSWVYSTLTGSESSAGGRIERWTEAFEIAINNPLGLGFGHVGSLARGSDHYYSCENSYLAMVIDFGFLGAVLYVGFLIGLCVKIRNYRILLKQNGQDFKSRMCAGAICVIIYYMVAMFFSNYIHGIEAMSVMYLFVGITIAVVNTDFSKRQ